MLTIAAALAVQFAILSAPAGADEVSVVVSRAATHTEIYMSANAEALFRVFDTDTRIIPSKDGFIDYAGFAAGTWGIGDALLSDTLMTIGTAPVQPEAMSFMLHPSTDVLPFLTPLDAMISIGVCNALSSDVAYHLSDMTGYVGYYIDQASQDAALNLKLGSALNGGLTLHVSDYGAGHHTKIEQYFAAGSVVNLVLDAPVAKIDFGGIAVSIAWSILAGLQLSGLLYLLRSRWADRSNLVIYSSLPLRST